jgi:hypothetical protein
MGGMVGGLGIDHSELTGQPFDARTGKPIFTEGGEDQFPMYIGDRPTYKLTELNTATPFQENEEYV